MILPRGSSEYTWDFPVAYSRTKYILIGFQNNRDNRKEMDNSLFDHSNLENVQVCLNDSTLYPRGRLNLKYDELKCGNLYYMFNQFKASYYAKNDDLIEPLVDYSTFLHNYPIIAIDSSHQTNVIKNSLINIKINLNWRENIGANLTIHCVMIMDKTAVYNPLTNRVIAQ